MSLTQWNAVDANAAATRVAQSLGAGRSNAMGAVSAATGTTPAVSSGITSNDFLNLLVTEMKNQDPTQPTDPNAYIQQLVGVNSLQQLIQIQQDLAGIGTTPPKPTGAIEIGSGS